jgi:hypothetical protein
MHHHALIGTSTEWRVVGQLELVAEVRAFQNRQQLGQGILLSTKVMVVLDHHLAHHGQLTGRPQLAHDIQLAAFDVDLEKIDGRVDVARESDDRHIRGYRCRVDDHEARERGARNVGLRVERPRAIRRTHGGAVQRDSGQVVVPHVRRQHIERSRVGLERHDLGLGIERLEEQDRHADVRATIDNARAWGIRLEEILQPHELGPEQCAEEPRAPILHAPSRHARPLRARGRAAPVNHREQLEPGVCPDDAPSETAIQSRAEDPAAGERRVDEPRDLSRRPDRGEARHAAQTNPLPRYCPRPTFRLVMRMRRLLIAAALAAGLAPVEAQVPMPVSAPWFPDTFLFVGNVIHAKQPGHLLIGINNLAPSGLFEIRMGESDDDGRTWRMTGPVYSDPHVSFFDPWIDRLPDGTLLDVFHGGHALTVMRSTDDGATWQVDTVFRDGGVEGEWRLLPPVDSGGPSRLALIYTVTRDDDHTSTYWIRTTTDGTRWSDPDSIGDGGAIWDATRVGVGAVVNGTVPLVYSYRPTPFDSVSIVATVLDARTLERRTPPHVVARVAPVFRGIGVFPIVLSCPDGDHVFYSNWQPGPMNALWEMTLRGDSITSPPTPFYQRAHMITGFGGVRFTFPWRGTPLLSWGELPNGPHTRVFSTPRPDLAGCAH